MNPMNFMQGINNPKQLIMAMIGQNGNPMISRLIEMAEQGKSEEVESFARNIFKEKQRNFDEEFSRFMKQIKK